MYDIIIFNSFMTEAVVNDNGLRHERVVTRNKIALIQKQPPEVFYGK